MLQLRTCIPSNDGEHLQYSMMTTKRMQGFHVIVSGRRTLQYGATTACRLFLIFFVLQLDRFIPSRPEMNVPLQMTPRTNRISKQFGLLGDRILNFQDVDQHANSRFSSSLIATNDIDTLCLLRKNASSLLCLKPSVKTTSVTENLLKKQHCSIILDTPSIQHHPDAYPIAWSKQNLIAVCCGRDVYYQNLSTRTVAHLSRSDLSSSPIWAIEWAGRKRQSYLASGMEDGYLQIWDATSSMNVKPLNRPTSKFSGSLVQTYQISENGRVSAIAWSDSDLLAVGAKDRKISMLDVRVEHVAGILGSHKDPVLAMSWSEDGNFLASSDTRGIVYIWDKRAGKTLAEFGGIQSSKWSHRAAVKASSFFTAGSHADKKYLKALAWCSWSTDLIATGSYSPEGKIRIWSTSTIASDAPQPVQTIPLNTFVYSLHWSPHCKELLSTHGTSFMPIRSRHGSSSTNRNRNQQVKAALSPLVNSITVHDYPSGKRLMSLSNAHTNPITHSCLGPDGDCVFTASPGEETIKMWEVWGKCPELPKERSAFDKHLIR